MRLEPPRLHSQTGLARRAAGMVAVAAGFQVVYFSLNMHSKEFVAATAAFWLALETNKQTEKKMKTRFPTRETSQGFSASVERDRIKSWGDVLPWVSVYKGKGLSYTWMSLLKTCPWPFLLPRPQLLCKS